MSIFDRTLLPAMDMTDAGRADRVAGELVRCLDQQRALMARMDRVVAQASSKPAIIAALGADAAEVVAVLGLLEAMGNAHTRNGGQILFAPLQLDDLP